jgi:hypothetical protein
MENGVLVRNVDDLLVGKHALRGLKPRILAPWHLPCESSGEDAECAERDRN